MYDKKIQDGCSTRRPDLFLDLGYQIIIIEIDENQHIDYDCSCENKRIMELSQDVGHRPIVFIRFNPDDYKNITFVFINQYICSSYAESFNYKKHFQDYLEIYGEQVEWESMIKPKSNPFHEIYFKP